MIKKQAPYFYERVGKYIIEWLKENAKIKQKPKNQKELAALLKVNTWQLSRYINGINDMPASCVNILIEHLGFKSKHFTEYYAEKQNGIVPESLTKEDLLKIIFQQNLLIKEWKDFGFYHSERVRRLMDDNREIIMNSSKLLEEIEKLRMQLKNIKSKTAN